MSIIEKTGEKLPRYVSQFALTTNSINIYMQIHEGEVGYGFLPVDDSRVHSCRL